MSLDRLDHLLSEVTARIETGNGIGAIDLLCRQLNVVKGTCAEREWTQAKQHCFNHPIRRLLHEDPYTWRAFTKPRGYGGDAVMLDYVYSGHPPDGTSPAGQVVFLGTTRTSNGASVVERRNRLARIIDQEAARKRGLRVLSLACGHLREAQKSDAVRTGYVAEFFALDQDCETLDTVRHEQARSCIIPFHISVKDLLRNRNVRFRDLDLVYASGLFDYLPDRLASKLSQTMWDMLASNGRMIIANFTPESHGRSYMEIFMDWNLIYRDEATLLTVVQDLPNDQIADRLVSRDSENNVIYLDFRRKDPDSK